MIYVKSERAWKKFLSMPMSETENFGLSSTDINLIEEKFGVVFVKDIQVLEIADLMSRRQVNKKTIRKVRTALMKLLEAVERGDL